MSEQMLRVDGLSGLLRAIAGRVQGSVDGLNTELLLQSAEKLDQLEVIADIAATIISRVPRAKGRSRVEVKVGVDLLHDLMDALDAAGKLKTRGNI